MHLWCYAYLPTSNVAIKATNDLLARGVAVYRAESPFVNDRRNFGNGTFVVGANNPLANELANQYGLDVYALKGMPGGLVTLHRQKVAVMADEGVRFFLKQYVPADPVAAQYPPASHGFVYGPLWFTSLGPGVSISASIDQGDYFVAGFWANWMTNGAAGRPMVVHGKKGTAEITLMGLNPTFRAHPEHTFRLVANAIYNGLD